MGCSTWSRSFAMLGDLGVEGLEGVWCPSGLSPYSKLGLDDIDCSDRG